MRLGRFSLISAITLSALRKRYFLPNMAVTEQKVQSKGQPQLVMIGIVESFSLPTSRRRSGNGRSSRSARASRGGLCTATPSRVNERPAMVSSSRSPASASMSSSMSCSPPSPRAT